MTTTSTWKGFLALLVLLTIANASPLDLSSFSPAPHSPLMKRNVNRVICGNYASASGKGAGAILTQLDNLKRTGGNAVIGPKSCGRATCWDTSAMYICNDQDVELNIPMTDAVSLAYVVHSYCGWSESRGYSFDAVSGQGYTDNNGGYNVGIGYANCNHSPGERPETYDPPGGNGEPTRVCGIEPNTYCTSPQGSEGCSDLTVESTESVTCNEYLGPAYVGAGSLYTFTTTRTIGTTWNVGGFAGINIGQLGKAIGMPAVTFSFSETVTTGDTAGANGQCGEEYGANGMPGNWTCGMDVSPKCIRVQGTCNHPDPVIGTIPYTVEVPQVNKVDQQSIYTANVCTCTNCIGWAEEGAPARKCNLDCETCNTLPDSA